MKPQRVVNGKRININMSNRLRDLRLEAKLTQDAIAERLEIPRGTYSTLESGVCLPTEDVLKDLTSILNCKPEDIYAVVYLDIIKLEGF